MTDPWAERLSEYLDGTLAADERVALERHLTECDQCRLTVDELRELVAEAGTLGDRPPAADLWPGVSARIRSTPAARVATTRGRGRVPGTVTLPVPWLVAAGVALALLSASGSWWLLSRVPANARADAPTPTVLTPRLAGASYDQAVEELQRILDAGRGRLDTATVRVLELNLEVIDRALREARRAIVADPANEYLRGHLRETMQQKLDLMRHAADLMHTSS